MKLAFAVLTLALTTSASAQLRVGPGDKHYEIAASNQFSVVFIDNSKSLGVDPVQVRKNGNIEFSLVFVGKGANLGNNNPVWYSVNCSAKTIDVDRKNVFKTQNPGTIGEAVLKWACNYTGPATRLNN